MTSAKSTRAHRLTDAAPVRAAVAGGAARVAVDDGVAGIDEHLRLVEQVDAVRGIRPAVDLQDHRERALPGGLRDPAVDRIAVAPVDR